MRALGQEEDAPEIPLTSLVDVVFLLLIFFLVATTFARRETDQRLRLPQAEGGASPVRDRRDLVIQVRSDGSVAVEGSLVSTDKLRGALEDWANGNPDGRVSIRGDAKADYQSVMRVLGLCRSMGLTDIDLPVLPGSPEETA